METARVLCDFVEDSMNGWFSPLMDASSHALLGLMELKNCADELKLDPDHEKFVTVLQGLKYGKVDSFMFSNRDRSGSVAAVKKRFCSDGIPRSSRKNVHRVGYYSLDERREKIRTFVEKRLRRTWAKKVKYDVRQDFANSRLRVRGRFVKKCDEDNLRDFLIMSM